MFRGAELRNMNIDTGTNTGTHSAFTSYFILKFYILICVGEHVYGAVNVCRMKGVHKRGYVQEKGCT